MCAIDVATLDLVFLDVLAVVDVDGVFVAVMDFVIVAVGAVEVVVSWVVSGI